MLLLAAGIGLAAGFMSGLFGGGAGLITVPGIYWLLYHTYPNASHLMQITIATGTGMAILLGMVSSWRQIRYGNVDKPMLKTTISWILLGSGLGCVVLTLLHSSCLKTIFSFGILAIAVWLATYNMETGKKWRLDSRLKNMISVSIGFISSFLGVSVFSTPYFVKLGLNIRQAIGTSTLIVFSYSVLISIALLLLGLHVKGLPPGNYSYMNLPILFSAMVPSMIGAMLGAKLVNRFSHTLLKRLFVGMMIAVALLMLF